MDGESRDIIMKLYYGEIYPFENIDLGSGYRAASARAEELRERLRGTLDEEQTSLLEQLCAEYTDAGVCAAENNFRYGYKLGVSLTAAGISGTF